jgi:transposase
MQDRQLYAQILGIREPWRVERVELALEQGAVHVFLEHDDQAQWPCPDCGRACRLHDHQAERRWRHLDTCQYQTILHAAPPRAACPEHGALVVKLPWAESGSRFTALLERLVIDWLGVASQKAVATQMGLSWDEVHGIMERAVARGLARRQAEAIPHLGVDEKSFRKGHRYFTIVNDLDRSRVLYVVKGRKQQDLDTFWATLTPAQLDSIQAVAMDMWEAYVASVKAHVPDGARKIVFDKFHIASHLGEAVDKVRRQENRALSQAGDDRLVGSKYQWLRNVVNFSKQAWADFAGLRNSALKTARAWALKETALALFAYRYEKPARAFFQRWYNWAIRSRLAPMAEVARMLKARLDNILTYLKFGITNAKSEALNSKIQWVKYTARGFRNEQNFVNAIYFHCGGLDLAPQP